MPTTVMILIDAFSIIYANKEFTPFIYNIAKEGFLGSLKPLFAFKGIETTLFTGKWPNEHGIFTEMQLRTKYNTILDKLFETSIRIIDHTGHDKIMKLSRVVGEFILRGTRSRLTPNLIPPCMLKYFTAAQHKPIHEPDSTRVPTIFDKLRTNKIPFIFLEPSIISGDSGTINKIISMKDKERIRFWYIKFSGFDREGHVYGPEPSLFKEKLIITEKYVEQIINLLGGIDNINLIILADHGMSRVHTYIDLMRELYKINDVSLHNDYIIFLDSIMARFWFFNNRSENKIREYLDTFNFGHVLSDKEKENLKIPFDRTQTGDITFVINEGYSIYPDFWSGTRIVKGMHGYAYPTSKESLAALIMNRNMIKYYNNKPTYFVDIADGVLKSLIYDK